MDFLPFPSNYSTKPSENDNDKMEDSVTNEWQERRTNGSSIRKKGGVAYNQLSINKDREGDRDSKGSVNHRKDESSERF